MGPDDPFYQFAVYIAGLFGIEPLTLIGFVPLFVIFFNLLGRVIPDDATGFLGMVRRVAKILGLYLSNRVASGISTNDVVKVAAAVKPVAEVPALLDRLDVPPEAEGMELNRPDRAMFPGVGRDPVTGKFIKLQSSWIATVGTFLLVILATGALAGCSMMTNQIGSTVCAREPALRLAILTVVTEADRITDPVKREAALSGAAMLSAILDTCPKTGPGSLR